MIKLGRVFSLTLVLAVSALVLLAEVWPDLMHLGPVHVVDWIGLLIFLSAPATWLLGIWHWARHFPHEGRRVVWGFVVVLGFVPGAVIYWFWGATRGDTEGGRGASVRPQSS